MRGHTIVVGVDRTGLALTETLRNMGEKVVAVETDDAKVEEFRKLFPGLSVVEGDAKEEETLELAGIRSARRVIVNTSSDSENMFIVVTARELNPRLEIFSRITRPENEEKLRKAGADATYLPESISGKSVAIAVLKPEIAEFIGEVLLSETAPYMIETVEIVERSPVCGRSIGSFFSGEVFGLLLALVRNSRIIVNPPRGTAVEAGDRLIVLGSLEQIENLMSAVSP